MNRRRKIGIALGIIVIITTGCIWHMVSSQQKEVKVFTATLAFPGSEMEADNYMEDKIAELTGARAEVTWLDGQNPSDLVKSMIVSGNILILFREVMLQRSCWMQGHLFRLRII